MPQSTTRDRRFYFPSEGRRAEDFFALKTRRLWPGLNPRARVPEASTLTPRPPKLLMHGAYNVKSIGNVNAPLYKLTDRKFSKTASGLYFRFFLGKGQKTWFLPKISP